LQVSLQPLVLVRRELLCLFQLLEPVLKVFDMAFFALTEGPLTEIGKNLG